MTRSPADSLDTVDSAPVDDPRPPARARVPVSEAVEYVRAGVVEGLRPSALADANAVHEAVTEVLATPEMSEMLAEQGLDASARDAFADEIACALTKPAATLRRFHRDPELPAVRCVEDLFPETSIFKSAIYALGPRELESIVCVGIYPVPRAARGGRLRRDGPRE